MLILLDRIMPKRTAMFWVLVSSSIYGLLWLPLRMIEEYGLHGIWAGMFFTFVPIPLMIWFFGRSLMADRKNWHVYFWAGAAIGTGLMLYTLGLILGSVTKTTVLFYLTPVWSSLLGMMFLGEKPRPILLLGNILGLTGCVLIMDINLASFEINHVDLLGLGSGISWSIGSVIINRYPDANYKSITLVQYIAATVVAFVGIYLADLPLPPLSDFAAALPLTAFVSICIILPSLMLIFRITQYISPSIVGILMLSEVFMAVVSASIILNEYMAATQWLGAGMIILTAIIITLRAVP
ncbi:MAG: DMT family transporter, partial [Candidatus Puniceispirillales bacterium WSBS_2018_MAG_OTU23]